MKVSAFFNACIFLHSISCVVAERVTVTLTTEEVRGDSHTQEIQNKPLVVHVDRASLTPEMIQHLSRTSNIVIPDIPELPEFINPLEFKSPKVNDDIIGQIANGEAIDVQAIRGDPRFSQLLKLLKDINDQTDQVYTSISPNSTGAPMVKMKNDSANVVPTAAKNVSLSNNASRTTNFTKSYNAFKQYSSSPKKTIPAYIAVLFSLLTWAN